MKKFRLISLTLTLLLGSAYPLHAQSEEQLIRAARARSNAAIAAQDTIALAAEWTEDFHIVSSRNSEVSGKANNRHLFATEFQAKKGLLYVRTTEEVKVNAGWNMAAESGHWSGTWQEPDGTVRIGGNYFAKWHKVKGEWKIRAEIFVPLSCEGSSFCDKKPLGNIE
jgi:ketosteroid isomerase-like protein